MAKAFIGVCRVSTRNQGESKLGLQSQRADIERWAEVNGYTLITIMDEVASGGWPLRERPVMQAALAMAKKMKAQVVVSKTDRASRNLQIIDSLMNDKKILVAIDLGHQPDEFVGTIFAGLAVKERKMIGMRTKAGLAAAKARGVVLGNRTNLDEAQALGHVTQTKQADNFADGMKKLIQGFQLQGMTLREMASELNRQEIKTARNKNWHTSTIRNVIARWE